MVEIVNHFFLKKLILNFLPSACAAILPMMSSILPDSQEILEKLIQEHPDSYVSIGHDKFIPTCKALFNLEYVRKSSEAYGRGFTIEKHLDLPIIFACDSDEEVAFEFLRKQLIYGLEINQTMDAEDQVSYMLLLFRLANAEEINLLISKLHFHPTVYIQIAQFELDLFSIFSEQDRLTICDKICKYHFKVNQICRYGSKCRSLRRGGKTCFYTHYSTHGSKMNTLREMIKAYGFIYMSDSNELTKLKAEGVPRVYRKSTRTLHRIFEKNGLSFFEQHGRDYDYENRINTSKCTLWCNRSMIIDTELELVYILLARND